MADEPGGKSSDLPAFLQDHEKVEEAKYYPPAPPDTADTGELPEYYGEPKVTLLPVGPYLAYAYWEVDLATLPPETASAVLRFHSASESSGGGSFDVDVDLRTRSWYVNLWKPAESYVADLGVRTASGEFISLAQSNPLQTPRAWPVAEIPTEPPEAVPEEAPISPETTVATTPVEEETEPVRKEEEPAAAADASESTISEEPPVATTTQSPIAEQMDVPKPVDAVEVLRAKLAEIYSLRQWTPRAMAAAVGQASPPVPEEADIPEAGTLDIKPSQPSHKDLPTEATYQRTRQEACPTDLTQLAETRFSPGFSSALRPEKPD